MICIKSSQQSFSCSCCWPQVSGQLGQSLPDSGNARPSAQACPTISHHSSHLIVRVLGADASHDCVCDFLNYFSFQDCVSDFFTILYYIILRSSVCCRRQDTSGALRNCPSCILRWALMRAHTGALVLILLSRDAVNDLPSGRQIIMSWEEQQCWAIKSRSAASKHQGWTKVTIHMDNDISEHEHSQCFVAFRCACVFWPVGSVWRVASTKWQCLGSVIKLTMADVSIA